MRALEEIRALARIPGPAGRDGVSADQISMEYDGERTVTFKYAGEIRGSFKMPIVIDRGVWREGSFEKGDGVTWGGHYWIAKQDTMDKPEPNGGPWRLAVKRGRDGKDGGAPQTPPRGPVKVG
jgi:hypothetical protein